jgi:hypothetical protein
MFCAPGFFLGVTDDVGSHFHVLRSRTRFERYRGRRVPFSCFALPDSFSTVARTFGLVGIFCAPKHVFSGNKGMRARFHVLRSRILFGRYRGRRVPFSCFTLPDSFSTVPKASGLVFIVYAPGLVSGGTAGVRYRFHVLRSRTRFRRYRRRRGSFS